MEDIELPVTQVDIIISEWMGYFLLYEGMLDTIIWARDRYLISDGLILPDLVTLNMVAIEDAKYKKEKYEFWEEVYGVNMSCIKDIALSEPLVDYVEKSLIMSKPCTFLELDLYKVKVADLNFSNKYELKVTKNDTVYALVCWFDAYFSRLDNPILLSTSPYGKSTHWKQTTFYLDKVIKARKGEVLKGSIAVKKSEKYFRNLDIKISFHYDDKKEKVDYYQLYKLR
jgi:protein arginine N-methyltransferase 1